MSQEKQPTAWCRDCAHFVPWEMSKHPRRPMPEGYNSCERGMPMRFISPKDVREPYGFYREQCEARKPREKPSK